MSNSYIFSGHETFHCKSFWLKKGYDYVKAGHSFNDEQAIIELGVGKNMVASIKYWMKAFGLLDNENKLTSFAENIFNDERGLDKYLEDKGTLWLLHYMLVINNYASIYKLIFVDYHRSGSEFDISRLENFIRRKCSEIDFTYNVNTVNKDIRTFIRNYVKSSANGNIEDLYTTLLLDLELIKYYRNLDIEKNVYYFNYHSASLIPYQFIIFIILEYFKDNTIDFRELMNGKNPLSHIFCLSEEQMNIILYQAQEKLKWLAFTDDAGIKQLQIKKRPENNWSVLESYYQLVEGKENAI